MKWTAKCNCLAWPNILIITADWWNRILVWFTWHILFRCTFEHILFPSHDSFIIHQLMYCFKWKRVQMHKCRQEASRSPTQLICEMTVQLMNCITLGIYFNHHLGLWPRLIQNAWKNISPYCLNTVHPTKSLIWVNVLKF